MNSQMKPGTIVDNRFRIVKILGKGGQGTIYLVEDTINDNARRALKTLRKEILPKNLGRMQQEVLALKGIKSEFVLSMEATNLDTYQLDSEEVPYFVTEFAEYGTLRKHNYFNGEIDLSLRLFRDICEGVLAVHAAGIVHRDLKPSNVLLVENEKDVRVGDFGLCYIDLEEDKERATSIREKVGPLFFAAPEQTSLPPNFTKRSDIYSLGRILDFMITGVYEFVPGDEYNPVTVRLGMKKSHPVDTLISKSTSFDPGNRPASVENVIEEIDKLLGIEPEEEPTLELSKMQERILKYIRSYSPASVPLGKILGYLANFYNIARGPQPWEVDFAGRLNWPKFVDRVENSLEQLEEAGLVTFMRGEYSAW